MAEGGTAVRASRVEAVEQAAIALDQFSSGDFGLTFENQGLRARVSLEKKADAAKGKP